jgi:hypothetical protein
MIVQVMLRLSLVAAVCLAWSLPEVHGAAAPPAPRPARGPLDPVGKIHIPIGIPNTLDTLKTFVEAEGNFSPGFATYGISFWIYDPESKKLTAPTMDGMKCEHGLAPGGLLIPWSRWNAGDTTVRTEVCQVRCASPAGDVMVVGARVTLTAPGPQKRKVILYAALRPLGPAGGPVNEIAVSDAGDALLVNGHPALVALEKPTGAGVVATDTVGDAAMAGKVPPDKKASSAGGDASGALAFEVEVGPEARIVSLVCPVLAGRRAVGHQWDGKSDWAQADLAKPNPAEGGVLQPDPGLDTFRGLKADALFDEAAAFWKAFTGRITVETPDTRWAEALAAIVGHAAMAMNDGAPDVAVINYNVFNRDGVYTANILQKSGQFDLAAKAIEYFLDHPFNGRAYPEADNPGQILWIIGEHWLYTRDKVWLRRVYPSVQKLAAMIKYCRTAPGTHWVGMDSLKFGDALPKEQRRELKPDRCDGSHPEYTEAFDIAGLTRAAVLAMAMRNEDDAGNWAALADSLTGSYDAQFGASLAKGYGSYAVLWPCRLYPPGEGKAYEQFKDTGPRKPAGWRYFPLATAHQGLVAGNRDAGWATLAAHLDHEQMRGWYAFDEGGKSGAGGWPHARTTWSPDVAMPHGWAIAELWLLLRDSLLFEDGDRLVILGGVPAEWLTGKAPISVTAMPTHFGPCSFTYKPGGKGALVTITGAAAPAEGFVLRLPVSLKARVTSGGKELAGSPRGDFALPQETKQAEVAFADR